MPRWRRRGPGLAIGEVARETGVSAETLRAWELRYGFPTPTRAASGHRRYPPDEVDAILAVVRQREAGLSLETAIGRARRPAVEPEPSLFAGVRRAHPDLLAQQLSHRSMLAISRAIEDECFARAERPVLVGCFQHERAYRASEACWRELARTATVTVVLADFPAGAGTLRETPIAGEPREVPLDPGAPLLREWAVVCDAPDSAACLVGWERPGGANGPTANRYRAFEAVWSVEPTVVRDAARLGVELASRRAPDLASVAELLARDDPIADDRNVARRATSLTNRILGFLEPVALLGRA